MPVVCKDHQKPWLDKLLSSEVKQGTTELFEKEGGGLSQSGFSFEVRTKASRSSSSQNQWALTSECASLPPDSIGTTSIFFPGKELEYRRRRFASRRRKLRQLEEA